MEYTSYTAPADGAIITTSDLDALVNSTELNEFDGNDFEPLAQTLVASQTDPPLLRRGVLWFKRGEGQLYSAQFAGWNYAASGMTIGTGYSTSGPLTATDTIPGAAYRWVAMAPRCEQLGIAAHGMTEADLPVVQALKATQPYGLLGLAWNGEPQAIPLLGNRDFSHNASTANAFRQHFALLIATESGGTYAAIPAVVRGFTDCALEYSVSVSLGQPIRVSRCQTAATVNRFKAYSWPYAVPADEATPGQFALVGWAREAANTLGSGRGTKIQIYKAAAPDVRCIA